MFRLIVTETYNYHPSSVAASFSHAPRLRVNVDIQVPCLTDAERIPTFVWGHPEYLSVDIARWDTQCQLVMCGW